MKSYAQIGFWAYVVGLMMLVVDASAGEVESGWMNVDEVYVVNAYIIYFTTNSSSFCGTASFGFVGDAQSDGGGTNDEMNRMMLQLTTALVSNKQVKLYTTGDGCTGWGTRIARVNIR